MNHLEQSVYLLTAISAVDAVFGGTLTGYLQLRGKGFWPIKIYQALLFIAVASFLLIYVENEAIIYLCVFWLSYWEDILYFWLLKPLSYFHELFIGFTPVNPDTDKPYEMFAFRERYTGWVHFVFGIHVSKRIALLMSSSSAVVLITLHSYWP